MHVLSCASSALIYKYPPHTHGFWEIVCQLEGEAQTDIGEDRYLIRPGDILLIPPHVVHKGVSEMGFRDLALRADDIEFSATAHFHDQSGDISALLSMICRLVTERTVGYEAVADSLTESVTRMIKHLLSVTGSPAVETVKQSIYENISNPEFSLAECIRKTGFDTDYFRRVFKKETGKTPGQYQIDLRIRHAKQLLSEKKRFSIEAVAHSCGFSDSLYFSTCFKKHSGMSPSAYRDMQQG